MENYWHSVNLDITKCNGCTNCLKKCPTEAIRLRNGKAEIINERCIDCGECIRVCPYHAKRALTDELSDMKHYKYNVALVSIPMYGQFHLSKEINKIFNSFYNLGFDEVYDVAKAADYLSIALKDRLENKEKDGPLISTLCPAIIRLIQIRFPSLIDRIIKLETPMEIAARLAKREAMEKTGLSMDEIGTFYITECPAKITSIKNPVGIRKSYVDRAISIESVYSKILKLYPDVEIRKQIQSSSSIGIGWAKANGQSYSIKAKNYLAVDGIANVIEVLEDMELGKLDDVDFFEGYACVNGCIGGPLAMENSFIAKARIRRISEEIGESQFKAIDKAKALEIINLEMKDWIDDIKPKNVMKLDSDIRVAINKMDMIEQIYKQLPGIDCGTCGAPSCRALAEDIVRGEASIDDCIIRKGQEANKK